MIDVLIDMLENIAKVIVKFYADDAAIADNNIIPKLPILKKIFDVFHRHTGLAMNVLKTVCIATGGRSHLISALQDVGWGTVAVVGKVKYLGLYMGHAVTLDDIFRAPFDKMTDRLASYHPIKSKFSLPKKVLIWNTWILPIYSYVFNYYILPSDYARWIDNACARWLNNGNTIKSLHLTRPTNLLGLQAPLRDTCNHNYARLSSLSSPNSRDPCSPSWSMRISTHRSDATSHVASAYGVTVCPTDSSASIYNRITLSSEMKAEYFPYIHEKLNKVGLYDQHHTTYISNYSRIPNWIPCYARFNNLSITHNILPTTHRFQENSPCFLCHHDTDSTHHLYGNCPVVKAACSSVWGLLGVDRPYNFAGSVCADRSLDNATIGLQVMLSTSVWRARCNAKWGDTRGSAGWPSWILKDTLSRIKSYSPSFFVKNFPNNKVPLRYKISYTASLGSSANTSAATVNVSNTINTHIGSLKAGTIYAFTDGSARPNPGPAGAGSFISKKTNSDPMHIASLAAGIGPATNNTGEIFAVGLTLEHCLSIGYRGDLHIYTDSKITQGAITQGWSAGAANSTILYKLRNLIHTNRNLIKLHIHWIPGHSDIPGNDAADSLANAGALYSNNHYSYKLDLGTIINNSGFSELCCQAHYN